MKKRRAKQEYSTQWWEYLQDAAIEWYFLNLFFLKADPADAVKIVDALVDADREVRQLLSLQGFAAETPMSVCVEQNLYFDVWLDAAGEIKSSDLIMYESGRQGG